MRFFKLLLFIIIMVLLVVLMAGLLSPDNIAIPEGADGTYIDIGGIPIRYAQYGQGQDLLFIHGVPGSLEDWEPIVSRLPEGYRATVYDRPGQGYSGARHIGYTLEHNARIAFGLIDELDLRNVIVIGHSYGGSIIMAMAVKSRAGIEAYIPVGGATYPPEKIDPLMRIIDLPYIGEGLAAIAGTVIAPDMIQQGIADAFSPNMDAVPKGFEAHRMEIWTQTKVIVSTAKEEVRLGNDLERIIPFFDRVLTRFIIIHGENDRLVSADESRRLHNILKNSELIVLGGTGHQVQFVRPEIVLQAIQEVAKNAETNTADEAIGHRMDNPLPGLNGFRGGWRRTGGASLGKTIIILCLMLPSILFACAEKKETVIRSGGPIRILALSPVISGNPEENGIVLSESPAFLLPGTIVDHMHVDEGLRHIENDDDARMMIPFIHRKILWAERRQYDAVVVKIMLNAALTGVDQGVRIPVVGPRDAAMEVARQMGKNPATIYPMGIAVADLWKDERVTFQTLLQEARKAVRNGADVLVIGCTGIEDLAFPLREKIDVPVLRNVVHALIKAEKMAKQRRP